MGERMAEPPVFAVWLAAVALIAGAWGAVRAGDEPAAAGAEQEEAAALEDGPPYPAEVQRRGWRFDGEAPGPLRDEPLFDPEDRDALATRVAQVLAEHHPRREVRVFRTRHPGGERLTIRMLGDERHVRVRFGIRESDQEASESLRQAIRFGPAVGSPSRLTPLGDEAVIWGWSYMHVRLSNLLITVEGEREERLIAIAASITEAVGAPRAEWQEAAAELAEWEVSAGPEPDDEAEPVIREAPLFREAELDEMADRVHALLAERYPDRRVHEDQRRDRRRRSLHAIGRPTPGQADGRRMWVWITMAESDRPAAEAFRADLRRGGADRQRIALGDEGYFWWGSTVRVRLSNVVIRLSGTELEEPMLELAARIFDVVSAMERPREDLAEKAERP